MKTTFTALFENARAVIAAEKLCGLEGIPAAVVPRPAGEDSDCGMALRIGEEHREAFDTLMKNNGINVRIYG